jgi:hypothetical protein
MDQMRLTPLPQRAATQQRGLSPADHAKATRLSREMALYTKLQGGSATSKPKLAPGTPEFARAAKQDYAELVALHGAPKLPASFVVKKLTTLPEPVGAAFDHFRLLHSGQAQIALSTIDGHRTWQAQVTQIGGSAQVLLIDAKGVELARGVVRGAAVSWRW